MSSFLNAEELKKFIYLTAILFTAFMLLLVCAMDRCEIGWQTAGRLPTAITATVFSWAAIVKWGWKRWPFTLLLRVPILEGTWTGHLESDWVRGEDNPQREIPIVFVIRQNLLSLTVLSFTKDRHGISYVAQLLKNEMSNTVKLVYVYSLREEFRAGEGVQQGTAEVRFIGPQGDELRGEYWTNSKTRGRLILTRRSSQEVGSFQEAKSKWNQTPWRTFGE
ncbi:MAG: hypothetical protein ABI380_08590 [Edaphobacter sp.]